MSEDSNNSPNPPKRVRLGTVAAMDMAAKAAGDSRAVKLSEIVAAGSTNLTRKSALPAFTPFVPKQSASEVDVDELRATGRDIRLLPLAKIHANPFQPREVYTPESLRERAESIRANGQYDLIHVIPHPDISGEFMIGDGWTRVTGCIEFDVVSELHAEVHHDKTPAQAAWMGYEQNEQRKQLCDLDRAFFFDKAYREGMTQEEVERRTGISQTKLSYYAAFKRLPDGVLNAIRQNSSIFAAYLAHYLARVSKNVSPEKAESLALTYSAGEMSARELMDTCVAALAEKKNSDAATRHTNSRVLRYANGMLKQKGNQFDMKIEVPIEKRDAFKTELEEIFTRYGVEEFADKKED